MSTRVTRPSGSRCGLRPAAGIASRTSATVALASTSVRRTTPSTRSCAFCSSAACTVSSPRTTTASCAWRSSGASGSSAAPEELAGAGVGDVLAVLTDRSAVDPHVLDTGAAGDEAVGTGGEIPYPFEVGDADARWIEGDQVGRHAFLHQAAVGDAEDLRWLAGEAPHRLLEGKDSLLTRPVREQMGREAGVTELAGVGAGVGKAEHGSVVLQQLPDLVLVVVGEHDPEAGLEALLEGEVDGGVEGHDTPLRGDLGHRAY